MDNDISDDHIVQTVIGMIHNLYTYILHVKHRNKNLFFLCFFFHSFTTFPDKKYSGWTPGTYIARGRQLVQSGFGDTTICRIKQPPRWSTWPSKEILFLQLNAPFLKPSALCIRGTSPGYFHYTTNWSRSFQYPVVKNKGVQSVDRRKESVEPFICIFWLETFSY